MGYSPRGRKESDTTEQLHFSLFYTMTRPPRPVPEAPCGRHLGLRVGIRPKAHRRP